VDEKDLWRQTLLVRGVQRVNNDSE